ncbi:flavodoxin family protein, partial [Candidatus Woesearchaeota archaeon]|nr:flavodoxin family protein [Candidatus Woesearchaeota archaeon]
MKVLGISGSPVKGGNNEKAIRYALEIAKEKGIETEIISLAENEVKGCIVCNTCKDDKGKCSIKDVMEEIRPKLVEADAIIIASPVYFGSLSSQLKALFDRTLVLRRDGFKLKDKIGAAIALGGSRNGGQELTIQAIHSWMHVHGMIVVGDNSHFGGTVACPFEDDEFGKGTVRGTMEKVCGLIGKIG